jgi:hypothetical protein
VPLIYFRASSYGTARFHGNPRWGVAEPYQTLSKEGTQGYAHPNSFQLICAGRDCYFGEKSIEVGDAAYRQGHADNFTNFGEQPLGAEQLVAVRRRAIEARHLSLLAAVVCTLVYPMTFLLARRETGVVVLSRLTRKQVTSMNCSDQWQQCLDAERRRRRSRALERFQTK